MTIDEAIKHAEEVADLCEYEASKYDMSDSYESHVSCQEGKCAEEHRQLAEWLKELKELKRLKEQEPKWIPCSEMLPEESGYYLVTVLVEDCYFLEVCSRWFAHPNDYDITIGEWRECEDGESVAAWMSLPEPYKENEVIKC